LAELNLSDASNDGEKVCSIGTEIGDQWFLCKNCTADLFSGTVFFTRSPYKGNILCGFRISSKDACESNLGISYF
jgi:hypothetical protein